jgi:hypothetical protein
MYATHFKFLVNANPLPQFLQDPFDSLVAQFDLHWAAFSLSEKPKKHLVHLVLSAL